MNKQAYLKSDIVFFGREKNEKSWKDYIRRDKSYCFIGIYNKDKTRVKNIFTGEIYRTNAENESKLIDKENNKFSMFRIQNDFDFYDGFVVTGFGLPFNFFVKSYKLDYLLNRFFYHKIDSVTTDFLKILNKELNEQVHKNVINENKIEKHKNSLEINTDRDF